MNLILENKDKKIELNGIIWRGKNKFFVEIEVPDNKEIDSIISNIKGYYEPIGNVTLLNNINTLIKPCKSSQNVNIYVYEATDVISEHINANTLQISSVELYYKELDNYFLEDYKTRYDKEKSEFFLTQKFKTEELLDNGNIKVLYIKTAKVDKDSYGHTIFSNPSWLKIVFKNNISFFDLYREMNKIQNCFGFVLESKMNLLESDIIDSDGVYHKLITNNQKKYEDINNYQGYATDYNSNELLKDILKEYYENEHVAASINMYYEYICNDLDNIFEFTSLINTIELILVDKKYNMDVLKYTMSNNEELKKNNKIMNKIFELITEEQKKFIRQFYQFDNVTLRDKIKFAFFVTCGFKESEKSEKYITQIIHTRNYYVHGGKINNVMNPIQLLQTVYLLKHILYILISNICTENIIPKIEVYKMMIPTIYDTIIKYV